MDTRSQSEAILLFLQEGRTLTPLEALTLFGCMRLGARVWELKLLGHNVRTEIIRTESGKRIARYSLCR